MKRLLILIISLPLFVFGQHKPLLIQGVAPDFYLSHTVAPKENFYSLGRLYNISPKEIAPFNKLELDKGLNLNQAVKVPLTTTNFVQENNAAPDEVLVPVYHTVKEKEGLYKISTAYNKVPVEKLKQWNNLKSESVNNGANLIVGYLKVKKELSALSGMSKALPAESTVKVTPVKETPKSVVVQEKPATEKVIKEEKVAEAKPKETETVKITEPPRVEEKPAAPVTVLEKASSIPARVAKNFNGGYFKNDFEKQTKSGNLKNENGAAAIFKSTSGWEDGKYYCLHNSAVPGTIVKITNSTTGKSIYAKVLDLIPDISQNTGLLIRLSNAAGAELGAGDGRFDCSISFAK